MIPSVPLIRLVLAVTITFRGYREHSIATESPNQQKSFFYICVLRPRRLIWIVLYSRVKHIGIHPLCYLYYLVGKERVLTLWRHLLA